MSAYMCGVEQWSVLAERISRFDQRTAPQLFDLLASENKASIDFRYARGMATDPDYMYDHNDPFEGGYRVPTDLLWSDGEYVLMAQGYEYQSCEHPGWYDSEAYMLIQDLYEHFTGISRDSLIFSRKVEALREAARAERDALGMSSIWNVSESSVSLATFDDAKAAMREFAAKH